MNNNTGTVVLAVKANFAVYALTGDGHAVRLPRGTVSGAGRSDHARKATVFKVTRRRAHRVKSVTGTGRPSRPPAAGRGGASSPALFVGGLPPAVAPVSICVWPPAPPPSRRLQSLVPPPACSPAAPILSVSSTHDLAGDLGVAAGAVCHRHQ